MYCIIVQMKLFTSPVQCKPKIDQDIMLTFNMPVNDFNINAVNFAEEVKCTDMLFAMCTYSAVGPNKDYIYWNINQ